MDRTAVGRVPIASVGSARSLAIVPAALAT